MKYLSVFLFFLSFSSTVLSQNKPLERSWNGFLQKIDVSDYEGGSFRLTAAIKADTLSPKSSAHMWARIDKSNGKMGYFNNMYDKPIKTNKWQTYTLEGDIDKKAEKLTFGGLYFNQGLYYFDDFQLKLKTKNGEWVDAKIKNAGFEVANLENWQTIDNVKGFEHAISKTEASKGESSLLINGSKNFSYGNNAKKGAYASVNGINVYYEVYGEGEPLVMLHGNSQSIADFKAQIPIMAQHFKVIAVDTRGQGNTTENGEKLTYQLFAKDLLGLLNHLQLERVNLLGWSDGGNTGLILAMNHPSKIKQLAVMGAVLYNDKTSVKPEVNKLLNKSLKQWDKQTSENIFEKRMINLLLHEPNLDPSSLKQIKCPTLVMAGSDDLVKEEHTKLIAQNINNSALHIFVGGSHFEPEENPKRFNKVVLDFFE